MVGRPGCFFCPKSIEPLSRALRPSFFFSSLQSNSRCRRLLAPPHRATSPLRPHPHPRARRSRPGSRPFNSPAARGRPLASCTPRCLPTSPLPVGLPHARAILLIFPIAAALVIVSAALRALTFISSASAVVDAAARPDRATVTVRRPPPGRLMSNPRSSTSSAPPSGVIVFAIAATS